MRPIHATATSRAIHVPAPMTKRGMIPLALSRPSPSALYRTGQGTRSPSERPNNTLAAFLRDSAVPDHSRGNTRRSEGPGSQPRLRKTRRSRRTLRAPRYDRLRNGECDGCGWPSVSRTKVWGAYVNLAKLAELRSLAGAADICHPSETEQSASLNDASALQISSFSLIAPLAVGLAFSGCTTAQAPLTSSEAAPSSAGVSIGQRDLTPEEKKVIVDAVAQSLRNPGSAKYHWAKFPAVVTEGSINYCATVDAESPHVAYNGRQAYVVQAQMSGNRVSSAVIGLIAGGKDFAIVTSMCAKYGLDPRNAS